MVYCELSPTAAARREKLTCKVCGRTFNRQEHLQRHARTHTKEKPYSCSCGHSFSRKDLLTRHERLAHASGRNSEEQSAASASPVTDRRGQSPRLGMDDHFAITASRDQSVSLSSIPQDLSPSAFLPPSDPDFIAHTGEPQMIDPFLLSSTDGLFAGCDDPISGFTRFLSHGDLNIDWNESLMDPTPTVRGFNSTEHQIFQQITPDSVDFSSRVPDDPAGDDDFRELKPLSCPWLVSEAQYLELNDALTPFRNVISHFVLPSRMAVARYTLGYVEGFSDHYPFLHIPTLQLTRYTQTPELVLAILAIGAQYRYETRTARSLYQASRSIVLERLQRGDLFPSTDPPARVQPYKTHMDRTRALLLLATYCSWHSHTGQMQEFSDYQSLIARSLRQIGLSEVTRQDRVRWTEWIDYETDRRTKFFGWILLSLQSLICNNPPLLLTRELNLRLPSSCQEWVARTEADWLTAASRYPSPVMFKEAHAAHLAAPSDEHPMSGLSPFANYILIHAVIQRIYMTHQISLDIHGQSLSARDAEDLEHALNRWRSTWCHSPESVLDLHNSYGSLSFTSTALLGVAHIRLHCNLGQWRDLQSGDPATVAATLQEAPLPHRGPHLIYALLHSVHSLNIPVQVGISYLSRCKSFSWSVDHAICDLECAAFLSKWLQGVADSHEKHPLSALETRVLRWIMRVVREALMSQDETMHLSHEINDYELRTVPWTAKLLSYAVVKVWAQMFKVCNSPWPMVGFIGQSLDHYAGLLHGSLADGGRHEGSGS